MTDIFVFGSNRAGRHGKGSALLARTMYGAIYGQGEGLQGSSYGIPTKDEHLKSLPLTEIAKHVTVFLEFAKSHPEYLFHVVPIGCGLAGYTPEDIAPMFFDSPWNVKIPTVFANVLKGAL